MELTQALEQDQSPSLGMDSGLLAGQASNNVLISDHLDPGWFDVLVDFTHPDATTHHVDFCSKHGKKRPWSRSGHSERHTPVGTRPPDQSWVMRRTIFVNLLGNDPERIDRAWNVMDVQVKALTPPRKLKS